MPPPGYEPFLAAICATPDDDTARLVYADWLDEHGDPDRAEFIRLQIAEPERQTDRMTALWRENGADWLSELPRLRGVEWWGLFRRGFVFGVIASAGKWFVEYSEIITRTVPFQYLGLNDAGQGTVSKVLAVPEVGQLTSLSLQLCRIAHGHIQVVTRCPRLDRLRGLTITSRLGLSRGQSMSDDEAREFVGTPFLQLLEAIHMDGWISEEAERLLLTRFKTVRFQGWRRPQAPPAGTPSP
ncbi:MAG TPA: TIGR02996 domain-containing protein [Gemmataceae bacterium]|nr:TIGR02996 domain-containing protein [Gemmataceae bacterium]